MKSLALCLLSVVSFASDVVSFSRLRNVLMLILDDGSAEIEWITSSTVRVRYGAKAGKQRAAVEFSIADTEATLTARNRDLTIEIRKKPFELRFLLDGAPVAVSTNGRQAVFSLAANERLYGLGPRTQPKLDLRGTRVRTDRPFLLSSRLYGLYFPWPGEYAFDMSESLKIQCPENRVDFYFYSAGGLKDVLEQHHTATAEDFEFSRHDIKVTAQNKPDFAFALPHDWPASLNSLLHAGFSAMNIPAAGTTNPLAPLMPVVIADSEIDLHRDAQSFRDSFHTHLLTYVQEVRDRGLPVIHPLPLQFPQDVNAANLTNEFMLGDEVLVATDRDIYFPQGVWTDLETGRRYPGRRTAPVDSQQRFRMFARNGTIVPRDRDFGIELHYFPKLGAEYFIPEIESGQITQLHAAPSVDVLRLQIEAAASRTYEWVIHHVARPTAINCGNTPLNREQWRYNEKPRTLHIRANVAAGNDMIWNVSFPNSDPWDALSPANQ